MQVRRRLLGACLLAMSLALAFGVAPASATTLYPVTASVEVGVSPLGVAVDPSTDTVYVANQDSNTVSVIDATTNTVTATVPVGDRPNPVAVDPSTNTIYVVNISGPTVSVIDGETNTVTHTIGPFYSPTGVAVDPSTHTVYVPNVGNDTVSVIDGLTDTVTTTVAVGDGPIEAAVDPTTHTVYVTNSFDNTISVIDGLTNTVVDTVDVGEFPQGITVDPSTHIVYVASESGTVSEIDGTGPSYPVITTVDVGNGPAEVAVDPSSHTAYVGTVDVSGNVAVIEGGADTVSATVDVSCPNGLAVNESTHAVYVSSSCLPVGSGTLKVITPTPDADLAISDISDITTDATGTAGATVSYTAPTVTDPDDSSAPAPTCSPASGSVFPIGSTTVTCTADDSDDANSPVSTTFTVTVRGAADQLDDLATTVASLPPGSSLADKVAQAQDELAADDIASACSTLDDLIHEAHAQAGHHLTTEQATQLITAAQQIEAVLDC